MYRLKILQEDKKEKALNTNFMPIAFGNIYHTDPSQTVNEESMNKRGYDLYDAVNTDEFFKDLKQEENQARFLDRSFLEVVTDKRRGNSVWINNTVGGKQTLTNFVLKTYQKALGRFDAEQHTAPARKWIKNLILNNNDNTNPNRVYDFYTGGGRYSS